MVSRAITVKIFIQVVAGYYFFNRPALSKNNPEIFSFAGKSLHGECRARPVTHIAFIKINIAFLHDLINIVNADVAAIHPAQRMMRIFDPRRIPVKR